MSQPENTSYGSINKRCHRLLVSQRAVQSAGVAFHVLSAILSAHKCYLTGIYRTLESKWQDLLS